ncbi:hypothetical protein EHZ19_22845 [Paraburkholderia bannensis]|uniref:hypothetical protein n=1 Tax=Paraburkholderia tropica TaxID=92647 RepID=UPI000F532F1D|nr:MULTISPECIES: hypothetical protein [Paraburkholderia]QNB13072.1 hypothetical protein G5S35_15490 [Paraburkholderia tropica]RQM45692.1 hypothetical protein EHZ19_22845 [Paraburkholderia bannensis]RQN37905.1 hypothetical protein EHZ25_17550 [Paraburkholderia tropica]
MVSPFLVVSDRGYRKVRAAPRKKPEKGAGAKCAERTLSGTCVGIEPSWAMAEESRDGFLSRKWQEDGASIRR